MTQSAPAAKEPFVYQAAKAALWAPLIALGLGICTQSLMKDSSSSAIIIGGTNCLLILLGFVMSIIALLGTFKYGTPRLLIRGLIGFLLSSLLICATLFLIFILSRIASQFDKPLIGNWQTTTSQLVVQKISLQPDKHFDLKLIGLTNSGSAAGSWHVARNPQDQQLYLLLHADSGTGALSAAASSTIAMQLKETHDDQITLIDSGRPLIYTRQP